VGAHGATNVDLAELKQLEAQYKSAVGQVEEQKGQALGWINRQKSRMLLQLEGLSIDRDFVGKRLEKRNKEIEGVHQSVRKNCGCCSPHSHCEGSRFGMAFNNWCAISPSFSKNRFRFVKT
jgi:hypothetical protein